MQKNYALNSYIGIEISTALMSRHSVQDLVPPYPFERARFNIQLVFYAVDALDIRNSKIHRGYLQLFFSLFFTFSCFMD